MKPFEKPALFLMTCLLLTSVAHAEFTLVELSRQLVGRDDDLRIAENVLL